MVAVDGVTAAGVVVENPFVVFVGQVKTVASDAFEIDDWAIGTRFGGVVKHYVHNHADSGFV
jgi:hypothetical protein